MDYQFPQQLFPSFYNCGPPNSVLKHCAGNWGSYDGVRPQCDLDSSSSWTFTPRHRTRGEIWRHTEPAPVPLLSPRDNPSLWPLEPPDPLKFTEHMENFFTDYCHDAFGCMGDILGENFNFKHGNKARHPKDSVNMSKMIKYLDLLKFKTCPVAHYSRPLHQYRAMLSDVVHDIPPQLLGSLLHEELAEQRERLLFCESNTGGALAFVPFSEPSSEASQQGCLLYPGKQGLHCLNFHKVDLQYHREGPSFLDASSSTPFSFQLKGPIRQIGYSSLFNECCVAVRSHYFCGVWRFSETNEPRLLQVVNTKELATCISVSPHVLGEVLVASESGAAHLWTVGKGMQKVRAEDGNLYFNAKSSWTWCEFSAHPRVMLYADRTGVELTDIRVSPASGHTLFRISSSSDCRRGERLILAKYLGDSHAFHHLITTQYSAYIMDERFPCVPMLKWDHMMQYPPAFCHVVPGFAYGTAGETRTTKVLLGSQCAQEITMLQYSGGRAEACVSLDAPQALLRPKDSLIHLPVQIAHRHETATNRLSSPAAGLSCIQKKAGGGSGAGECLCILQLTEAGDIFYQILEPEQPDSDASGLPAAAGETQPQRMVKEAATSGRKISNSQLVVTSSDEDIVGPTQCVHRVVAETPERKQEEQDTDYYSEDSESGSRIRNLKRLHLQVVVNEDPELDQESRPDVGVTEHEGDNADEHRIEGEIGSGTSSLNPGQQQTPAKLSNNALVTWKHWLQKLMRKSRQKKSRPHHPQLFSISTKGLLQLSSKKGNSSEKTRVEKLRQHLKSCMSARSLLVHSTVSDTLGAAKVVPFPNPVDTDAWTDPLSQRLTLSWQGEEAWRAWWEDELGLNKESKAQALRRKRRKEKDARRAAGNRLELSGSFTSSISSQSELSDFSDLSGWSSAASQASWSDVEDRGVLSQLARDLKRGTATPSTIQSDTPVSTPAATPQYKPHEPETPSTSHTLSVSQSTPIRQRRDKSQAEDYLNSLFAPQVDQSQNDFLEMDSTMHAPPSSSNVASFSQLRSSQSAPRSSIRVGSSRDVFVSESPSQSQSFSQSSQGRQGLSQSSQPRKKKSRMGF
ncbi:TATA box-binding protein-associated factor RNA polymerase I subunit C [Parambassis ranga]|uniref:TATA box-binding protein-associated factor RNA polymerase I subunit C n=1 Tax=Parambassis ranga TaxID=210632 RepID=A0A6P7JBU7_9TELE|nr:TATA box-binding protein-associated factor RNA polymerase I subunit C [Parambassis ranga]